MVAGGAPRSPVIPRAGIIAVIILPPIHPLFLTELVDHCHGALRVWGTKACPTPVVTRITRTWDYT